MNNELEERAKEYIAFDDADHDAVPIIRDLIADLVAAGKRVIHCGECGNSWYDSGFTPGCPTCEIIRPLESENARLKKEISKFIKGLLC